jgi:hypothetical protein
MYSIFHFGTIRLCFKYRLHAWSNNLFLLVLIQFQHIFRKEQNHQFHSHCVFFCSISNCNNSSFFVVFFCCIWNKNLKQFCFCSNWFIRTLSESGLMFKAMIYFFSIYFITIIFIFRNYAILINWHNFL